MKNQRDIPTCSFVFDQSYIGTKEVCYSSSLQHLLREANVVNAQTEFPVCHCLLPWSVRP